MGLPRDPRPSPRGIAKDVVKPRPHARVSQGEVKWAAACRNEAGAPSSGCLTPAHPRWAFPCPPSCGMCIAGSCSDRKSGAGKQKAAVSRLTRHLSAWEGTPCCSLPALHCVISRAAQASQSYAVKAMSHIKTI